MVTTPWMPGATFIDLGPDGGQYDETQHPKGCIHTTEGTSLAGAEGAYAPYPPHLGYDPKIRVTHQHVRLDRYSYAFKKSESDDEFIIQVEIVGFARDTHNWPWEWYRNIGEDIIKPLREIVGIPDDFLQFYGEMDGIILADENSPIRISDNDLRHYRGWLGHQHMPSPDEHWDPGKFRMHEAISYSRGVDMAYDDSDKQRDWEMAFRIRDFTDGFGEVQGDAPASIAGDPLYLTKTIYETLQLIRAALTLTPAVSTDSGAAPAPKPQEGDVFALVNLLKQIDTNVKTLQMGGVTAEEIVAAQANSAEYLQNQAIAFADELDRRNRDNDPATGTPS